MIIMCVWDNVGTFCTETSPTPTCACPCAVTIWFHGEEPLGESDQCVWSKLKWCFWKSRYCFYFSVTCQVGFDTVHYSCTSSGNEELSFFKSLGRSILKKKKKKKIVLKVSSINSSALVVWLVPWLWNSLQVFILCIIYNHSHDSQISPSSHTKNTALSTWRISVRMLLYNVNYAAFSCMFWVSFFFLFLIQKSHKEKKI